MYYGTKKCKNKTLSIQRVYSTLSDDSFKDDSSEEISAALQRCCIVFVQSNWWIGLSTQQSLFKFQQIYNCIIAQTLLKENITAFKWQFDSYFFHILQMTWYIFKCLSKLHQCHMCYVKNHYNDIEQILPCIQ